jgi:hypothetical protein
MTDEMDLNFVRLKSRRSSDGFIDSYEGVTKSLSSSPIKSPTKSGNDRWKTIKNFIKQKDNVTPVDSVVSSSVAKAGSDGDAPLSLGGSRIRRSASVLVTEGSAADKFAKKRESAYKSNTSGGSDSLRQRSAELRDDNDAFEEEKKLDDEDLPRRE